jgi:hypothetical protein
MIKRLLIIGALTGAAHLTTIIVLKILTGSVGVSVIKTVGELDSIFNLVINILAAGLLISTTGTSVAGFVAPGHLPCWNI